MSMLSRILMMITVAILGCVLLACLRLPVILLAAVIILLPILLVVLIENRVLYPVT